MNSPSLFERRRGTLVGTFVGDTLGLPYETTSDRLAKFDTLEVVATRRAGAGAYSDDTEMAVAVAEELAEVGTIERRALARRFAEVITPQRGYGTRTRLLLGKVGGGVSLEDATAELYGDEGGSSRNGASMRVAPVGAHFAFDPYVERRRQVVESAAASGHTLPLAVDGAFAQAEAVASAVRGEPATRIFETAEKSVQTPEFVAAFGRVRRLLRETPTAAEVVSELGNGIEALTSVPAAIWAAVGAKDFEDAARRAIALGGDADTIGAMACAIAGARFGADTIPGHWLSKLDNSDRGIDFVEDLCRRLWA